MRVAVANLTAGGFSGGYVKYLKSIVPHLLREPAVQQLDVFVPEAAAPRFATESWPVNTFAVSSGVFRGSARLRETIRRRAPDVVFVPTAAWIHVDDVPVVVMVRNMEPLEAPFGGNPPLEAGRNLLRRVRARRACSRAKRVIAVSDHVRQFLIDSWGMDPRRIGVVRHGVDPPGAGPEPERPAILAGVDNGFLFTAGSIRPARGLTDLIEALPAIVGERGGPLLVIAGQADRAGITYRDRLRRRAERLGVSKRVRWAGPLDVRGMRWCYEACGAFVMTSRAEACPNVALEAMSHGCACVSVDHPPMPEFFQSAAVYYPSGGADALAAAVNSLLSRRVDVAALRAAAVGRAADFEWRLTAAGTVAELQAAVDS